jgi:GDPmannose 4,6-dehydratase
VEKRALICGVTGQDGAYLASLLLKHNYEVWGSSRDALMANKTNLIALGIAEQIKFVSMAPKDFRSVLNTFENSDPDEVYFLAGQTSVGLSFEQPAETLESIVSGLLNVLEVIRFRKKPVRLYHAGSSECFGDNGLNACTESTPFKPQSPYAVAKASAHWLISNYREAYGIFAVNGILFNHESPLRPKRFVTQKIITTALNIKKGSQERLELGRLDISRDWGWAPDYVEAMWLMLQNENPDDLIIATGESHTLQSFVETVFKELDMDWREHTKINPNNFRPSELQYSAGNPSKAKEKIKWQAQKNMSAVIKSMLN